MDALRERVASLFSARDVVTTEALAEALYIDVSRQDRTRAIRLRLKRTGLNVSMIGNQAWILNN